MSEIHGVSALPVYYELEDKDHELYFIDPTVGEGKRLCSDDSTDIPKLFAMIRQWITSISGKMGIIFEKILKSGININDIDSVTGMSLLHYAIQLGALNEKPALSLVKRLLSHGANPNQRGLYSDMNALHIAVYFNISSIIQVLLKPCELWPRVEIHAISFSYNGGTALHIAAENLNVEAVEVLLQYKACPSLVDDLNRQPVNCVPSQLDGEEDRVKAEYIVKLLKQCSMAGGFKENFGRLCHDHLGKKVKVSLNANKDHSKKTSISTGTLRYLGSLHGLNDIWAGIELDEPRGKNNGSYNGKPYFHCRPSHGIFALASHVTISTNTGNNAQQSESPKSAIEYKIGDKVIVDNSFHGEIRFVGETHFAAGTWYGVELDKPMTGCNNGSVGGIHYFFCEPSVGIFVPQAKLTLEKNELN